MAVKTEIEIKLSFSEESQGLFEDYLLKNSQNIAIDGLQTQSLKSIYFDTDNYELNKNKIAVRIRERGEQKVLTVKASGSYKEGLHVRNEWELPLKESSIDYEKIAALEVLQPLHINQRLKPVFTLHTQRKTWLLSVKNTKIEMALDECTVSIESQTSSFSEVELELIEGDAAVLQAVANQLVADLGLVYEPMNKAERGYQLLFSSQK